MHTTRSHFDWARNPLRVQAFGESLPESIWCHEVTQMHSKPSLVVCESSVRDVQTGGFAIWCVQEMDVCEVHPVSLCWNRICVSRSYLHGPAHRLRSPDGPGYARVSGWTWNEFTSHSRHISHVVSSGLSCEGQEYL